MEIGDKVKHRLDNRIMIVADKSTDTSDRGMVWVRYVDSDGMYQTLYLHAVELKEIKDRQ